MHFNIVITGLIKLLNQKLYVLLNVSQKVNNNHMVWTVLN